MSAQPLPPLTTQDGAQLALYGWPLPPGQQARARVLVVHGLGEHAGRYAALAAQLNAWGFDVHAYDQRGHGHSSGLRGALPHPHALLDDLAQVVDHTRASGAPRPLLLLGHSLGGLVAARFVSLRLRPVDGLVLSSPALDAGMSAFQKWLLAWLPKVAPRLRVGNGLKPRYLSHDPAVAQAYQRDPLVHDRVGVAMARFLADGGPATVAAAPQWTVPTLLMYAGADRLVNPDGSRAFAAAAPPNVVTTEPFEAMYHELFHELDRAQVFERLRRWLDTRH